ncbi:hypothetical protein WK57_16930 [Burkholderia ubonensis]|uniref:Transposase IS4-like domain-containing protein n=1 Tax=Burkholderia ubonensis TaxID=101571 RepID=A0A125CLE4_9BURK|nr:hypothetical protein WL16_22805 [Burkholderia ubonensis]KWA86262.1 hypothetical protein WL29_10990 [Burkholderia ubonensis]KWB92034.1 hypothetical protein WL43_02625 [Burkholderia ubonensis]KWZ58765.1 hypothetical protein WK57_16930 [Burkholderia ubonensis]
MLDGGNTSRDVWADKGYVDGERERRLGKTGWRLHIQRKGQAGKPLSACQARRNRRIAQPRARVEHVFAALEQMGGKMPRSIGLARARLHLNWKAAMYNLRRLCSLREVGPGRSDTRNGPGPAGNDRIRAADGEKIASPPFEWAANRLGRGVVTAESA